MAAVGRTDRMAGLLLLSRWLRKAKPERNRGPQPNSWGWAWLPLLGWEEEGASPGQRGWSEKTSPGHPMSILMGSSPPVMMR